METKITAILEKFGKSKESAIPVLQAIQDEFNYLPQDALEFVCENSEITPAQITGISTFYSQFRHTPAGKYIVKVCIGTACHVKGAMLVYDSFLRELKIDKGQDTDNTKMFTVEKVACLGCCTIAPVVQIGEHTYGNVKPENVKEVLDDFCEKRNETSGGGNKKVKTIAKPEGEIRIGLGSCCMASGSKAVKESLETEIEQLDLQVNVKHVGCVGICNQVPMMEIHRDGKEPEIYTKIDADEVSKIIHKHFEPSNFVSRMKQKLFDGLDDLLVNGIPQKTKYYDLRKKNNPVTDYLNRQINIACEYSGVINPSDIEEYKSLGGFKGLTKALTKMKPAELITEIKNSGLRGRGGGGFPSGIKWELAAKSPGKEKYLICNGDEGDPGAFMDRMLLESYPFRIVEGIIIAAYAVGAQKGVMYIRAEYPLAVIRVREAIENCKKNGYLGKNILNSGFDFELEIFEGAGAFVCGEETALIASIEGKRGLPAMRPPYPSDKGLWGKPTLINNTETFSLVPWIISNGAERFKAIGTNNSAGTKVFALAGKIAKGGLIEVPMGITIRQIVEEIGGGIVGGKKFKAVQIGGPSGGCIPERLADTTVDFASLQEIGAMMGSGGLIVLDESDCMVDIARYFLEFTQDQSCGKCTFCRVGTKHLYEILTRFTEGKATHKDLENLERISYSTKAGSLCGLGKTAPNPVLTTLKYFRHEYEEHINGKCRAGKCQSLIKYEITNDCIGCVKCARICPVGAIEAKPYERHKVNNELCVACDACRNICPVDAVIVE